VFKGLISDKGTPKTAGSVEQSVTNYKSSPAIPAIIFGDLSRPVT